MERKKNALLSLKIYIFFSLETVKKNVVIFKRGSKYIINRMPFFKERFLNIMHPYLGPALHTFKWENISSAIHIKWDK